MNRKSKMSSKDFNDSLNDLNEYLRCAAGASVCLDLTPAEFGRIAMQFHDSAYGDARVAAECVFDALNRQDSEGSEDSGDNN